MDCIDRTVAGGHGPGCQCETAVEQSTGMTVPEFEARFGFMPPLPPDDWSDNDAWVYAYACGYTAGVADQINTETCP